MHAETPGLRHYAYVGPRALAERCRGAAGWLVASGVDVRRWMAATGQEPDACGEVTATFVIDLAGTLRLADRHSEHVACAGGADVLAAGEMTFAVAESEVSAVRVTNQSTGYCPEPESWPAVARALDAAGIAHPGGFTTGFLFRRCDKCGQRSVVQDGWFYCDVCGATLPENWNFA